MAGIEPRIERAPALTIAGLRKNHRFDDHSSWRSRHSGKNSAR